MQSNNQEIDKTQKMNSRGRNIRVQYYKPGPNHIKHDDLMKIVAWLKWRHKHGRTQQTKPNFQDRIPRQLQPSSEPRTFNTSLQRTQILTDSTYFREQKVRRNLVNKTAGETTDRVSVNKPNIIVHNLLSLGSKFYSTNKNPTVILDYLQNKTKKS